jgi:hypothetical protein
VDRHRFDLDPCAVQSKTGARFEPVQKVGQRFDFDLALQAEGADDPADPDRFSP